MHSLPCVPRQPFWPATQALLWELGACAEKLQKQADWFTTRIETLKGELGISPTDECTVEGVIVVNHPRLWMYASQEPLPIVSDKDLFDLLTKGERLTTPAADVTSTL